jgi:fermentation-respiration switch protein FrsA (DUF1100 family)
MRIPLVVPTLLAATLLAAAPPEIGLKPPVLSPVGNWEGTLKVSPGMELRLVFHVTKPTEGEIKATFDSPDQGAAGLKVDSVAIEAGALVFEMKSLAARFQGTLNVEGTEAVGTWSQSGLKLPFTIKRTDAPTELKRPQTPTPPYPYVEERVTYENRDGGVTLAGTLTEPKGSGPFPAVILISGSGPQDRDGTILGHKPFWVLADALTRRGIAVLRVDDRGVGGSTGKVSEATSLDSSGDVTAGIAFLKTRPEINAKKIGLIGHSEGGLIAPIVATQSSDVAFIVLLAGPAMPGDMIIRTQSRLILQAMGTSEETIRKQLEIQKRLLDIVKTEKDDDKAAEAMRAVAKEVIEATPEDQRKAMGNIDKVVEAQVAQIRSPWFRFFLTYDPRPVLAKVKCPVLALNGELDLQVPPRENLVMIERVLHDGGNLQVTSRVLPKLNHLFQTAVSGAPTEYGKIEETLAPEAIEMIGDWIEERVKE